MARIDRALAALLLTWAALSVLPVGSWAGLSDGAYYADAWGLWASALLVTAALALLVLVVTRGAVTRGLAAAGEWALAMPRGRFLAILGLVAGAEAALVALLCFARQPQSVDAWAQWFQARVFLNGSWVAPPPPSIAHFATLHMQVDRGWFSQFPPIHPALLAVGMALGAAWLITPALFALFPVAVYALGRTTGDERVARVAAVLALLSPFGIAMGASGMNHVPAALLVAAGLALVPAVAAGSPTSAALLGGATGLCFGIRPADAGVLAAVGVLAVVTGVRRRGLRLLAPPAIAGLLSLAPTLLYNAATTGNPLVYTYSAVWGPALRLGLGHAGPWGESLTLARALGQLGLDGHQMNVYLLEWPVPVLALAALGVWTRRRALGVGLRACAAYVVGLAAVLFFYFHRDTLYGPRLLFSATPALLVLLATGILWLGALRRPLPRSSVATGECLTVGLAAMLLVAVVGLIPSRLASYSIRETTLAAHPEEDAAAAGLGRAVVLMRDGWGSRLVARMWDAGLTPSETERIYQAFDACTLQELLDAARTSGEEVRSAIAARMPTASPGRRSPGVVPDPGLRLPTNGYVSPRCASEIEADRDGTVQFAAFLYLNDPWLRGDVVWARDLGAAVDEIGDLFPRRAVYRYVVGKDGSRSFVPLASARLDGHAPAYAAVR